MPGRRCPMASRIREIARKTGWIMNHWIQQVRGANLFGHFLLGIGLLTTRKQPSPRFGCRHPNHSVKACQSLCLFQVIKHVWFQVPSFKPCLQNSYHRLIILNRVALTDCFFANSLMPGTPVEAIVVTP